MKSAENTFTTQGLPLPGASRHLIPWPFRRFWWLATRRSAGEKRRMMPPTTRPCSKPLLAWPTTLLLCARVVPGSPRRCWIGITSANMAPTRPTDRRKNAPNGLCGYHATCAVELDRHPGDRDLLRHRGLYRLLPAWFFQHQRRVLHGRARDDRLDCRPELCFRQPGLARAHGVGRFGLSIRHPCHALVLDRRYPRHALSRHHHDAVLLHLENPLRTWIPETTLRRWGARAFGCQLRVHDHPHERNQYVLDGHCDEGGAGMGPELQHLGFFDHGRGVCRFGRSEIVDL